MRKKYGLSKIVVSLMTAIICSGLFLLADFSPVMAEKGEETGEPLVVGVPGDRCPVFYQDAESGETVGIGVDLMRTAAENVGYEVSFKIIEEATIKAALDNGAYDVIMPFGSAVPSASGKKTIVTDNFIQTPFTFVTKGNQALSSLNSLRVGMLSSLAAGAETVQERYPGMTILFYETMDKCVEALRGGQVEALLHNSYVWSYVLQKPSYSDLKVQPTTMFSMDFRAGALDTPKGRVIVDRLNQGIGLLTDTRRQAITLDYTSRRLYKNDFSDYCYQYRRVALMVLVLITALLLTAREKVRNDRRRHEEKLQQMMDYDALTGLLSMRGFRKRVEALLREYPTTPYYLSYNNIRNFKYVNDSLGRKAGDELLKFWAKKSMEQLSEGEAIGRVGGDQFAVLRHSENEEKMLDDENHVIIPVQNFFINQGKENRIQICSGIYVLTPQDYKRVDVDHMLDLARVAEKRVKENRKANYEFYNPEQWQRGKSLAEILNYLPGGLASGDIQVWYQPQINYETGRIIGAEALCRWNHDKLGWLYPFNFISILEEAGLIFDLDAYVWETVCKDLRRWNENGCKRSVSVNVSRDDFRDDRDIPGYFQKLIKTYGLTPDQLRIEITETAYVENADFLINATKALRNLGFQVEMDDFGSGYSSLHMLKDVPLDRIKLDLHFLRSSGDIDKSRTIISCMIQMVHLLGMEIIAEGVETVEQAEFLKSKGGFEMQGYYFYRPMPVGDFEKLLNEEAGCTLCPSGLKNS